MIDHDSVSKKWAGDPVPCADPDSFARRGPTLKTFFLINERREDPPQYAAFRWRADDGPTLNAGMVALYFFRGFGPILL